MIFYASRMEGARKSVAFNFDFEESEDLFADRADFRRAEAGVSELAVYPADVAGFEAHCGVKGGGGFVDVPRLSVNLDSLDGDPGQGIDVAITVITGGAMGGGC